MEHIMIDIETAATSLDATILSIGAVSQDGRELYVKVNPNQPGRSVCIDTMRWWANQDKAVRQEAFSGKVSLQHALAGLSTFLPAHKPFLLWAKPPQFDIGILENAYSQHEIVVPWKFRQVACLRTVARLIPVDQVSNDRPHSALSDAKSQMETLIAILLKASSL